MIKLKEQIAFTVTQVLLEVKTGFRWEELKAIKTVEREHYLRAQERRIEYAKKHLKRIGRGGSRIVFLLSSRFVLKLADTGSYNFGKEQNQVEVGVFTNPKVDPIITKVYDADEEYNWIVAELVRPVRSSWEFEELTGMNFGVLIKIMANVGEMTKTVEEAEEIYEERIERQRKELRSLEERGDEMKATQYRSSIRDEEKAKALIKHPIVASVLTLMSYGRIMNSDLSRLEHWGKTADGRVVVLDYGYEL